MALGGKPLERRGMAQAIADRVREAILSGSIAIGERVNEVELASSFEVSRGPVREAIQILRQEGLLDGDWHRASTVRTFTRQDVEEIYTLRVALESLAAERVISHADESELARIRERAVEIEKATEANDFPRMLAADMAFHDELYASAHHAILQAQWRSIRSQLGLLLLLRQHGNTDYSGLTTQEHHEICDVLEARDTERAVHLIKDHIRLAYERVLAQLPPDTAD